MDNIFDLIKELKKEANNNVVTERSIQLTIGIFEFAERANQKEPECTNGKQENPLS